MTWTTLSCILLASISLARGHLRSESDLNLNVLERPSRRAALLLFGISYQNDMYNQTPAATGERLPDPNAQYGRNVDFRRSVPNYRAHILSYLRDAGFDVDVFISTNDVEPRAVRQELLDTYRPVEYEFQGDFGRVQKLLSVVRMCLKKQGALGEGGVSAGVRYDRVLITRFDLLFKDDLSSANINWSKLNIVSRMEKEHGGRVDDNFYALPGGLLPKFAESLESNYPPTDMIWDRHSGIIRYNGTTVEDNGHLLLRMFDKPFAENYINYIKDESTFADMLTFFRIVRLCSKNQEVVYDVTDIKPCVTKRYCNSACIAKFESLVNSTNGTNSGTAMSSRILLTQNTSVRNL